MSFVRSFVPGLLAFLCGVIVTTHAVSAIIEPQATSSSPEASNAYRFVLRDPQSLSRPFRRGRYKIVLLDGALTKEGAKVIRGTTDDTGRTEWLRTQQPLEEGQWEASPVVGHGSNHAGFLFVGQDTGDRLANIPYVVDMQEDGLYCGHADEQGATAQLSSQVATRTTAAAFSGSFRECLRLRQQVAKAMAARSPTEAARLLEAIAKRRNDAGEAELLLAKAQAVVLGRGSPAQVQALLARKLRTVPSSNVKERASILNSIGYDLIDQHPPRHAPLAHDYLRQAVALTPDDPDLLDSLAWSLHLLQREDEALTQIDASIAAYALACDPEALTNRQIAYSHRGSILWSLGRRDEALDQWAMANRAGRDGEWSAGLDAELVNVHIPRRSEGLSATHLCGASAAGEPLQAGH